MAKQDRYQIILPLIKQYLTAIINKANSLDTNYLVDAKELDERRIEFSIGIRTAILEIQVLNSMKGVKSCLYEITDNENDYGKMKKVLISSFTQISEFDEDSRKIKWSTGAHEFIDKIESHFDTI